ncbi:hypothetical protein Mapa_008491 [Marchantia paleacea]|nr:hypothetical protein Mapa_008491 [Marchantia paleacea]
MVSLDFDILWTKSYLELSFCRQILGLNSRKVCPVRTLGPLSQRCKFTVNNEKPFEQLNFRALGS